MFHSGEYPHENQFFKYTTKSTIKRKLKKLHLRLFDDMLGEVDETPKTSSNECNLKETIVNFICNNSSRLSINNDIKVFEGTKERTERLDNFSNAI